MSTRIRSFALVAGSFMSTLALLFLGYAATAGSLTPTTTASPTAGGEVWSTASPTPIPFAPPTPPPSWTADLTPHPTLLPPLPTFAPIVLPNTPAAPGDTVVYTLKGSQYDSSLYPAKGSVGRDGDWTRLRTWDSTNDAATVTWKLPADQLPALAIADVDVLVCGRFAGDFWVLYGPKGSQPEYREMEPPAPDGCWAFTDGPGTDLSAVATVSRSSVLTITSIQFAITFAGQPPSDPPGTSAGPSPSG